MSDRHRSLLADTAALASLAGLTLLFFWKIALTNRILAGIDLFAYFYPYRAFVSESMRSGTLPLWNPSLFMGAPLLANSQAAVLYPLHWPLMWLSPPKQVAWSIVAHIWLAGAGTYLLTRRCMGLNTLAAWTAGVVFSLGGFLGAQVEHLNQLNAAAWFPGLLICIEGAMGHRLYRWLALLAGSAIVALMLLAGHTQAAYIVLAGAAIYALMRGLAELSSETGWQRLRGLRGLGVLGEMVLVGLILSAGQLLPSIELAGLSVRSGGLPYREAASFSLKPTLVFKAFLPPLAWDPPFSEYVAYVGLAGLVLAAVGAWATVRRRGPLQPSRSQAPRRSILSSAGGTALILALVGVFLALGAYNPVYYVLYRLVPGFALFRVPARWLLLYSFGVSVLAGIGMHVLPLRKAWKLGIALVLILELFLAGRQLAYDHPTAPAAIESMRSAPAHLLSDETGGGLFRFLSMSDILYDPGDLSALQALFSSTLSQAEIYDLVVATKMKEVLAYNLPLLVGLYSVDGYDGGLLPIESYVTLERLFLDEDEIWSDGRMRQQLRQVPPVRLLSLLNVKHIVTDKMQDVWIDNAFYDLEHTQTLGGVTLDDLPDFEATHLGIVSHLTGTAQIVDGMPVGQVSVTDTAGGVLTSTLIAGVHTAAGRYDSAASGHGQARIAQKWSGDQDGYDYVAVLDLGQVVRPTSVSVRSLRGDQTAATLQLRGLTLIDSRTGTSRSISVNPALKLIHSGDVKVYENLAVPPRAYVVGRATVVQGERAALARMSEPDFDPGHEVVLLEGDPIDGTDIQSTVEILTYEPEFVQLQVSVDAPGYLVLADAYYPGWEVTVDGVRSDIARADLYFRAVALEPGDHKVIFAFRPRSVRIGLGVGLVAWVLWSCALVAAIVVIGRRRATRV